MTNLNIRVWATITLIFVTLGTVARADDALSVAPFVVGSGDSVNGHGLPYFANAWWQWAASAPPTLDPVQDRTGANCGTNQQGAVWFLAGGYGTSRISRTCTVPQGRYIFFPVINVISGVPPTLSDACATAKRNAARNNDTYVYIRVSLNGSEVDKAERFRIASEECFDLLSRLPQQMTPQLGYHSATDGYWIMLKPLPAGQYHLEFKAFYTNNGDAFGVMVQNISYDLTIAPS
jgi:hypothetical protein